LSPQVLAIECKLPSKDVFDWASSGEIRLEASTMDGTLFGVKAFEGDDSCTLEVSDELNFRVRPHFGDSSLRDEITTGAGIHVICAAITRLHFSEARFEALLLQKLQKSPEKCTRIGRTNLWVPLSELPMVTQNIIIV
jgi:hypothetical protein